MTPRTALFALLVVALATASANDETILPITNGGFEDGADHWNITEYAGVTSTVTDERAASGEHSLKIVDTHSKHGSNVRAEPVEISGAGVYELRGTYYPVSGSGLGMYVRVLDEHGDLTVAGDSHLRGLGGDQKKWLPFTCKLFTSDRAASLELWIHSYSHANVEAYLDDLHFVALGAEAMRPPWEGQYKLTPQDTDQLTPADVVGPDGIVYPNWTKCGVQGGIPDIERFATIEQFGGKAGDEADDSEALSEACAAAGEAGGGAVILGEGTYYLDRPVTIRHDNVVIRGQGHENTKVIFRYGIGEDGVQFYWPPDGSRVGRNTRIEIHCVPSGLQKMRILADDEVIRNWSRSTHSGNSFGTSTSGGRVIEAVGDGEHTLKGVAEYRDGTVREKTIRVTADSEFNDTRDVPSASAAICFEGRGWAGPKVKLASDGERGDMEIQLESTEGLEAGDRILIDGPATERWKTLTQNACKWGTYRRYQLIVEEIDGHTVRLNQPLRIDFPTIDGSYVQKITAIEQCGVEDFYLEQTENLWISSVLFSFGWNCWGRGVYVKKCGRFPIYGRLAKWCEIRDCVFDDAWFKGGGGTAYAGWEHSYDCLMDNCETFKLRHAPLYQWSASGCVIRNSVFHESDGQWHSGWTNNNLFENCVITSVRGHGGYGFGMWASPPEDTAHGPNGPRNVVYNCDCSSVRDGLWMGGMNENWLILHNRFVVDSGRGVFMKTASFDHIIKNNVFVLKDEKSPMVFIATPDCIGVEIISNSLYGGNGEFAAGPGSPAVLQGNEAFDLPEDLPPRPQPAVPSIYQWQQENVE